MFTSFLCWFWNGLYQVFFSRFLMPLLAYLLKYFLKSRRLRRLRLTVLSVVSGDNFSSRGYSSYGGSSPHFLSRRETSPFDPENQRRYQHWARSPRHWFSRRWFDGQRRIRQPP